MFELDLTRVDYTWQPAGESQPNTFTAQNIFKSPSATVAGGVFQSSGTVSAIPAGYGGSNIVAQFLAEESSAFPYTLFEATGNAQGHILALRASRGTYSARTATQSSDILGQLDFGGHNSSSLVNGKGSIRAVADQTWTAVANGTRLELYTTTNGSTSSTLRLTLSTIANFAVPVYANSLFLLNDAAGTTRAFRIDSALSRRWQIIGNNTAEGGSNAGTDFEIRRYSDAGADLGLVISVTRSTGNITFNGGGGITSFAANKIQITTAQTPATSAAAGNAGDIAWDDNYLYVRMSTGWRRIALGAAF